MKGKQLHDFLFTLYDYADTVAELIQPEIQGSIGARAQTHHDNAKFFLTLIYIEWIFDTYGRDLISRAATESRELDAQASLSEAHRRIDLLRQRIDSLAHQYDFNADIDRALARLATDWRTTDRRDVAAAVTTAPPVAQ